MSLKNKTVLITGAAKGIGRAAALEFAKAGSKVIIADIDNEKSKELETQIKNLKKECYYIYCDVTKEKDVKKLIRQTKRKYERIDILVNNAAVLLRKPINEIQEKEWDKIINTKIKGLYNFVKNISEDMKDNRDGKIISIASIAGIIGLQNSSAHSVANGGIINLTKQLATELSPYKINVNSVSPGIIATDMTKELLTDKKIKERLLSNIPLNRIGTPEEVADAILFLASEDSNFITGHNLVVDGGWLTH